MSLRLPDGVDEARSRHGRGVVSRSDPGVAILAEIYSAEAGGYLEVYSPYLLPFQRRLVGLVEVGSARRMLDLGAGPGTAIPLIRAAAPDALVVAADRAFGMIALAPADSPRVTLDAMDLPFGDGTFDVVTMAFMAFHLPDPATGFAEARTVLVAGGRLGSLRGERTRRSAWRGRSGTRSSTDSAPRPKNRRDCPTSGAWARRRRSERR